MVPCKSETENQVTARNGLCLLKQPTGETRILEVNSETFCHYHTISLKALSPTVRNNEADARREP